MRAYAVLLVVSFSFLTACGGTTKKVVSGGGGSSGSSSGSSVPLNTGGGGTATPPPSSWVDGKFEAVSKFQSRCANPRSGKNPDTGEAYTDKLGSLLDEKNWLRSWNDAVYLWYDEVEDINPASIADPVAYFKRLKTKSITSSGEAKDKYHHAVATKDFIKLSSGESFGYGATFTFFSKDVPREVVVSYTQPNSPASHKDVGLKRGTRILEINGVDIVNTVSKVGTKIIEAGLFPKDDKKTFTFKVQDVGEVKTRLVSMKPKKIIEKPVLKVTTLDTEAGKVGYLLFNDHIESAEQALIKAVNTLKKAAITDLVLDLRYNGGGVAYIANELSAMIASADVTKNRAFMHVEFNDKYPDKDPFSGEKLEPTPFRTKTVDDKTVLPHLGLSRVFVLTGSGTCSASELIMNGLRGADINVIQIGNTTCGKPYGFYPTDNCGTTYFTTNFEIFNGKAIGGYADGFSPENLIQAKGKKIPGCYVEDDYTHPLGDKAEKRLATALAYRAAGKCPASSQQSRQFKLTTGSAGLSDGETVKPFALKSLIMK